jgi:putative SOS response-associated peptidase YedK
MCISFANTFNQVWVKKHFNVTLPDNYPAEAFPGYKAPLILKSHQSGRVACGLAEFGLIPHWSKDKKIQKHTYNARLETIQSKPSYRHSWRSRHFGIAVMDAFYEPLYQNGKSTRTAIRAKSQEPLGVACIWDTWQSPTEDCTTTSFSLITINADKHPVMRMFHQPDDEKRTIVCLQPEYFHAWLDATTEQAIELLQLSKMTELE